MRRRHHPRRGYLVTVLSIVLALVSVAYLALCAYSAGSQDLAKVRRAETAAYYAAESGLLAAEARLLGETSEAPSEGVWLTGVFSSAAGSRFRVEILSEGYSQQGISVRATGFSEGEQGRLYTAEFEARYELVKGKGWRVAWRGKV